MNIENFWGNVKYHCKQNNLTQRELASKMGVNVRLIENQIAAKKIPSLEEVLTFCDVFNISINELLKDVTDKSSILAPCENSSKAVVQIENTAVASILDEKERLTEKLKEIQAVLLR